MNRAISSKLKVAVVVPEKRFTTLGGLLWTQRYGPLQVASKVRDAGYDVRLYNEELGLRANPEELARTCDVVGFSAKTSALTRAEKLARSVKDRASRAGRVVVTVLGGEHACMCGGTRVSEAFDFLLPGEAEEAFTSLLDLLDPLAPQDRPAASPPALERHCDARSFSNVPDLSLAEGYLETVTSPLFRRAPFLWALKNGRLPMLNFQATRGCPYGCAFCPTPASLQGLHYRRRSLDSGLRFLEEHSARTGIRRVMFEDPTAAIPFDEDCRAFFQALARSPARIKATALVRADLSRDEELLKIMRAAGVSNLSIGIESLSDRTLDAFRKKSTFDMAKRSVDVFHRLGFSVTGLFIVGYDSDDPDSFSKIQDFIEETGIEKWRVSPITQMPELSGEFMPAHRYFLWSEFEGFGEDLADYCNGEFVVFYPRYWKPSLLQKEILRFNVESTSLAGVARLAGKDGKFRSALQRLGNNLAQRAVQREVLSSRYIEMLQEAEEPFYVEHGGRMELQEERLRERYANRSGVRGEAPGDSRRRSPP